MSTKGILIMINITPALESEKLIIGALLLDCSLYELIQDKLCPSDFSDEGLKKVYTSMIEIYKKRKVFDAAMIADDLDVIAETLCQLANECFSIKNLEAHADIIREKSVQRHLIEIAEEIR